MRRNQIVSVFTVLALAAALVCIGGPLGNSALAKKSKKKDPPSFQVLYSFAGETADGSYPAGSLIRSGTILYGMTYYGGTYTTTTVTSIVNPYGFGTIFEYNTSTGKELVLHSFGGEVEVSGVETQDGYNPAYGSLIRSGTTLYGMTYEGGTEDYGTIFSYSTQTGTYKLLYSFQGGTSDGSYPYGSLTLSGETLYGMTEEGGYDNKGTIFAFNVTTGKEMLLHSFCGDGEKPYGSLVLSGKTLYGMTYNGGYDDEGTIFAINRQNGEFTVLHQFWQYDGSYPWGSLTLSGTTLYGMTSNGGEYNYGTIFALNTENGELTTLYSFQGGTSDGREPYGNLILSGTTLYGMTYEGGYDDEGTIFAFNLTTGKETLLHSFTRATTVPYDGAYPYGSLTLSETTLYGMTWEGGEYDYGVIFSYSLE